MSIVTKTRKSFPVGKLEIGLLLSLFGFLYFTGMSYYGARLIQIPSPINFP